MFFSLALVLQWKSLKSDWICKFIGLNSYSAWAAVTFQLHPGIIPVGYSNHMRSKPQVILVRCKQDRVVSACWFHAARDEQISKNKSVQLRTKKLLLFLFLFVQ